MASACARALSWAAAMGPAGSRADPQVEPGACFANCSTPHPNTSRRLPGGFTTCQRHSWQSLVARKQRRAPVLAATVTEAPPHPPARVGLKRIILPPDVSENIRKAYREKVAQLPMPDATKGTVDAFEEAAHAVLRECLPKDVQNVLETFMTSPDAPSALFIRGFPVDHNLPPSSDQVPIRKEGRLSEAVMLGLSRYWGRAFLFGSQLAESKEDKLVRDLVGVTDNRPSTTKSSIALGMHREFLHYEEPKVPDMIMLFGIRADPLGQAMTTLCDFQALLAAMDPADVETLRQDRGGFVPVKMLADVMPLKPVISGPAANPTIHIANLFEAMGAYVEGSQKLQEAYMRMCAVAESLADGVHIGTGDLLVFNNNRTAHGRSKFENDLQAGGNRWLQRTFVKVDLWGPGSADFPSRVMPVPEWLAAAFNTAAMQKKASGQVGD